MGDQLASLEASLKASDAQAGNLRQELASLGPDDSAGLRVNGQALNGSSVVNLPKGYYYTLADAAPAEDAAQQPTSQSQSVLLSAESIEKESGPGDAFPQAGDGNTSSRSEAALQGQTLSGAEEQVLDQALLEGDGSETVRQSSDGSSQQRAAQPGVPYNILQCTNFITLCLGISYSNIVSACISA